MLKNYIQYILFTCCLFISNTVFSQPGGSHLPVEFRFRFFDEQGNVVYPDDTNYEIRLYSKAPAFVKNDSIKFTNGYYSCISSYGAMVDIHFVSGWIQITSVDIELNDIGGPGNMYGDRRINISNGKMHIFLPQDVPTLGFSYIQTLYNFLVNLQPTIEVLRGEFPDYMTYELAFRGEKKPIGELDGHDGVWLKSHRLSKNKKVKQVWRNAMAAIVQNQWQGVLAPFEQIGAFYGYLDDEVKKKGHEIKWQRGAKVLVDALAKSPIRLGGLEGGSIVVRDDVETILCELNLGICDYAITKFYDLFYLRAEEPPLTGDDAYMFDYGFIEYEQQNVAPPIYDKTSQATIATFQDIVDKNWRGGTHGLGARALSIVTPAFNAFTRPAKVTDELFRTGLPTLMLYLDRHIPTSDRFKFADGTLDMSYKDVIRNGDFFNGKKSHEIP